MWCDWYDRGGCSEPPYGVIGFTDRNYIIYCSEHAVEALEYTCDYIGTRPGVDYDDEEDTNYFIAKLAQRGMIEQWADMYGGKQKIADKILEIIENNMNDRPDLWAALTTE